jgi:hypothetical protein
MIRTFGSALAGVLLCASLAPAQAPSASDSAAIIERARQQALHYTLSQPDFVCSQIIHRYASFGSGWVPTDTLTIKLSYHEHAEVHKLTLINGKPTDATYESVGGAISAGEFGGILQIIFNPDSQAAFAWQSWKTVRKHRTAIYDYAVSVAHSPHLLAYDGRKAFVGIHGVVEIDTESGEVLHLTYLCYEIPKQLNVESASTSVDYDFADVGGRSYLLPVRSETEMRTPQHRARNKTEFRDYHKFSADSVIDFGTGK